MICQNCGIEAPTKHVAFYQNIGVLVARFSSTAEGNMCKSCIHRNFWQYTLTTLVFGWWGLISMIITPFFLLNNITRYAMCLTMEGVPEGAMVPELTEDVVERLQPHTDDLIDQLNHDEDFDRVVEDIADKAGTTRGEVALYVHALVLASQEAEDSE